MEWEESRKKKKGKNINNIKEWKKTIRELHPSWINTPGLSFTSFLALQWYPNKVYQQEKEWCRQYMEVVVPLIYIDRYRINIHRQFTFCYNSIVK